MSDAELIYDKSKRNLKLREKIENEMFINRSDSQEAAYEYVMNPKKPRPKSIRPLISIIGIGIIIIIYATIIIWR